MSREVSDVGEGVSRSSSTMHGWGSGGSGVAGDRCPPARAVADEVRLRGALERPSPAPAGRGHPCCVPHRGETARAASVAADAVELHGLPRIVDRHAGLVFAETLRALGRPTLEDVLQTVRAPKSVGGPRVKATERDQPVAVWRRLSRTKSVVSGKLDASGDTTGSTTACEIVASIHSSRPLTVNSAVWFQVRPMCV